MKLDGVSIVRERCRLVTPGGVWYTITFERLIWSNPERADCVLFPAYLVEEEDGLIQASYPDGSRETFVSIDEINTRFDSRVLEFVSDKVVGFSS